MKKKKSSKIASEIAIDIILNFLIIAYIVPNFPEERRFCIRLFIGLSYFNIFYFSFFTIIKLVRFIDKSLIIYILYFLFILISFFFKKMTVLLIIISTLFIIYWTLTKAKNKDVKNLILIVIFTNLFALIPIYFNKISLNFREYFIQRLLLISLLFYYILFKNKITKLFKRNYIAIFLFLILNIVFLSNNSFFQEPLFGYFAQDFIIWFFLSATIYFYFINLFLIKAIILENKDRKSIKYKKQSKEKT